MNEFERLIAYLKIAYHNMTTLHRHLVDDAGWFGNHNKLGEWYSDIAGQIDDLTETGLALGYVEPTIQAAVIEFANDVKPTTAKKLEQTFRAAFPSRKPTGSSTCSLCIRRA